MAEKNLLRAGLDVGSTTVKIVVLSGTEVRYETYRRHNADILGELATLLSDVADRFGDAPMSMAVAGSGGLSVAQHLGLPFVQEVIAETEAIRQLDPDADVIVELGGEDAKITYLKPVPEQRMNGSCAGGTGAFIDQMATLLHTDAGGLDELAARHKTIYPIASRCGVFAKSDLQPLINEGAPPEDLAASVFQAVATQTIAGLAQGRPIRGRVVFLGGPLHFLPQLRAAFERSLSGQASEFHTPGRAQLYVALGTALLADAAPIQVPDLVDRLKSGPMMQLETGRMRPLFADDAEQAEFHTRHAAHHIDRIELAEASGPCFLGIDAGSTTIKAVLIDSDARIAFSHYSTNGGDPVAAAVRIVGELRAGLPTGAEIARSCVTGYGEGLIQTALGIDEGEIETMAHYRAAAHLCPDVTSVIDIGGQDMKYLRITDGVIDSIAVNEACSSGCGSFLQTFAEAMGTDVQTFATAALASFSPVDLGSRCTVFMNSSVKQAQKEGASIGDISAGLSYAVIRNALYKVIKLRDPSQLGDQVVVQGGTFLNDAVLRAFELLTGRQVVRPDIAGLMGAYGAALIAQERYRPAVRPHLLVGEQLQQLRYESHTEVCRLCQNHCKCTISTFSSGERHVSGNRCERGADNTRPKSALPNLFDFKYRRLFGYRRLKAADAIRGDIGIPRVLNMYENFPLWFTVLSKLGFRVVISGRSSHDLFEKGMDSISSENICYPAKLVHGHIVSLVERGLPTIFYPSVSYEQKLIAGADNHFNCPVVTSYPQVVGNNIEQLRDNGVRFINPFLNLANREKLAERLVQEFADFDVTPAEAKSALEAGFAEDQAFRGAVRAEGHDALRFCAETGTKAIVLAGRPYHVDPEVHHGVPELINGLGMAVLTEDSVLGDTSSLERPLRVRDQWAYHSRLYEAAAVVAERAELQLVQLNSFGCGLDAITSDQVQEILAAHDDVYTSLKIDEVSNLGAARIRLRSLAAAVGERARHDDPDRHREVVPAPSYPAFTKKMRREHTIIAPQLSPIHFSLLAAAIRRSGYRVEILEHASKADVDLGLQHVNNDACYPAIMVVGQLVNAFAEGTYDPDNCSVMITQTGGMCRATNYVGLLRKALAEAGYPQVPVIALSTQGLESNPGFKVTPALAHRGIQAVVLGDLLQNLLLRVRPYELQPGSAAELYQRWDAIGREYFEHRGHSATLGRKIGYRALIDGMVEDFDRLPLTVGPRKPRVGIVGEILVKFQPDANNNVVGVIESEGCEAVLPGLTEFLVNGMYLVDWNKENLGTAIAPRAKKFLRSLIERYREPARVAMRATNGKFTPPGYMPELTERATAVLSLGNQSGEGWLLTAEMLELIDHGVPNIVCAQPFACLPNHVTGKGMFGEIRRQHPEANIVAIDYDPGASEVNQLNRIKLMIATARLNHNTSVCPVDLPMPSLRPQAASERQLLVGDRTKPQR